jgi:hypothetical protein
MAVGDAHTLPLKTPTLALHVRPFVRPPVAVAAKLSCPGAKVWFAGEIGDMFTVLGVTRHVVETTFPFESETVRVYVLAKVSAGVGYEVPLTADAVMSELPTPVEPMTALPPEKVGTRFTDALYGGVALLGTMLFAEAAGFWTVKVAGPLVAVPAEFDTTTVKMDPVSPAAAAGVV